MTKIMLIPPRILAVRDDIRRSAAEKDASFMEFERRSLKAAPFKDHQGHGNKFPAAQDMIGR